MYVCMYVCNVMSCHVMSCHVMLCYAMLWYVITEAERSEANVSALSPCALAGIAKSLAFAIYLNSGGNPKKHQKRSQNRCRAQTRPREPPGLPMGAQNVRPRCPKRGISPLLDHFSPKRGVLGTPVGGPGRPSKRKRVHAGK